VYSTTAASGSIGVDVQQALANDGYYDGPIDGVIGPRTRDAIASFLDDHGLRPTGTVNGPLLDTLGLR
jgi:peptidoglycan hydrolase-like protein with peptidoglycan-binding domain